MHGTLSYLVLQLLVLLRVFGCCRRLDQVELLLPSIHPLELAVDPVYVLLQGELEGRVALRDVVLGEQLHAVPGSVEEWEFSEDGDLVLEVCHACDTVRNLVYGNLRGL